MKSPILVPHPDCPPPDSVEVAVGWTLDVEQLTLEVRVSDPFHTILWPAPAVERADNLWQTSCFEAFIGSGTGSGYAEFNLSPSGAWAAYGFDDYRIGMRDLDLTAPPQIARTASNHWQATLDLTGLADLIGPAPWRLAITAVIEAEDDANPTGRSRTLLENPIFTTRIVLPRGWAKEPASFSQREFQHALRYRSSSG